MSRGHQKHSLDIVPDYSDECQHKFPGSKIYWIIIPVSEEKAVSVESDPASYEVVVTFRVNDPIKVTYNYLDAAAGQMMTTTSDVIPATSARVIFRERSGGEILFQGSFKDLRADDKAFQGIRQLPFQERKTESDDTRMGRVNALRIAGP